MKYHDRGKTEGYFIWKAKLHVHLMGNNARYKTFDPDLKIKQSKIQIEK